MCYNNPEPAAKKERTGTFLFEDTGGNKMEEINYQQKFEELFCTHIKREGAQQLLEWLKKTDFFSAPASTKYHCACQHGLVMHSISVFETMAERFFEEGDSMESFAISQAYERYPLAVKLHLADVYSTYLKEKGTSAMR